MSASASGLTCPGCAGPVHDIDVKCGTCGRPLGSTGSLRILGTTVLGQYELVDVLGQGGMSIVYKGKHALTGQEVALKLLPPELAAHAQVKGRFLEEARALAALDHPNIVHLYNFGQENGAFVLAMQFIRGKTWERLIMDQGKLDWEATVRIAIDVLRALEYAHGHGVIHRDMKPSNVLVRESDGAATVMDFGIAKMTTSTRLTETGQTMGTVRYMSPEQVRGMEVDATTDLYSLGATIYESLVGDTPFDGTTHFDIMSKHLSEVPIAVGQRVGLPAALDAAVMRALRKKPEERFATARDFRKALEAVLASDGAPDGETRRIARDSLPPSTTGASARKPAVAPTPAVAATQPRMGTSSPVARSSNRLWIGLALLVVAAAGGTVAYLATRPKPAPTPVVEVAPSYQPYTPKDVPLTAARAGRTGGLQALAGTADVASTLQREADAALRDFNAYATTMGAVTPFSPDALFVVALPRKMLCDPATYAERDLNGNVQVHSVQNDCEKATSWYRPTDRTMVVADDPAGFALALRAGIPLVVDLHRPDLSEVAASFAAAQAH